MKKRRKFQIKLHTIIPLFTWLCLIFFASSTKTANTSDVYWQDFVVKKLAHIIEYGILSALTYRFLKIGGLNWKTAGYYSIIFSFLYGMTDEFHQSFTLGREPTIRDVIFDTIGASTSIFIIWKLLPALPKRLRSWAEKLELL